MITVLALSCFFLAGLLENGVESDV